MFGRFLMDKLWIFCFENIMYIARTQNYDILRRKKIYVLYLSAIEKQFIK